jgi:hypothetical protein
MIVVVDVGFGHAEICLFFEPRTTARHEESKRAMISALKAIPEIKATPEPRVPILAERTDFRGTSHYGSPSTTSPSSPSLPSPPEGEDEDMLGDERRRRQPERSNGAGCLFRQEVIPYILPFLGCASTSSSLGRQAVLVTIGSCAEERRRGGERSGSRRSRIGVGPSNACHRTS